MVGALQYLTITSPDLTHVVNSASQYMQSPMVHHFQALKHILRYVNGTLHYGLYFSSSSPTSHIVYSNADWAGCPDTRRSTSGYTIFWVTFSSRGVLRNNLLFLVLVVNLSIAPWLTRLLKLFG
jgi:hypothetical protein